MPMFLAKLQVPRAAAAAPTHKQHADMLWKIGGPCIRRKYATSRQLDSEHTAGPSTLKS